MSDWPIVFEKNRDEKELYVVDMVRRVVTGEVMSSPWVKVMQPVVDTLVDVTSDFLVTSSETVFDDTFIQFMLQPAADSAKQLPGVYLCYVGCDTDQSREIDTVVPLMVYHSP